ncbi:hypothetical protein KAR91_01365 [Candidatus Pacearchaeota archaeon]|nr:hypothetical protein [Candidatus Pacearchaeota archaeon]
MPGIYGQQIGESIASIGRSNVQTAEVRYRLARERDLDERKKQMDERQQQVEQAQGRLVQILSDTSTNTSAKWQSIGKIPEEIRNSAIAQSSNIQDRLIDGQGGGVSSIDSKRAYDTYQGWNDRVAVGDEDEAKKASDGRVLAETMPGFKQFMKSGAETKNAVTHEDNLKALQDNFAGMVAGKKRDVIDKFGPFNDGRHGKTSYQEGLAEALTQGQDQGFSPEEIVSEWNNWWNKQHNANTGMYQDFAARSTFNNSDTQVASAANVADEIIPLAATKPPTAEELRKSGTKEAYEQGKKLGYWQ